MTYRRPPLLALCLLGLLGAGVQYASADQLWGASWLPAILGEGPARVGRALLQQGTFRWPQPNVVVPSTLSVRPFSSRKSLKDYQYMFHVTGVGMYSIPTNKAILHWANDVSGPQRPGVNFAVEIWPYSYGENGRTDTDAVGWAGLGWCQVEGDDAPPQMINSTAVIGWLRADGTPSVDTYDLRSKNVFDIIPQPRYTFAITNGSVEETANQHLILRFRRAFDRQFTNSTEQHMIMAYNNEYHGLRRHNWRSGLHMLFSDNPTARTVKTRLNSTYMQAHAWSMFVVWGVLLPLGIMIARYFRDDYGRWYMVHLGVQSFALLLLIAAFAIPLAANKPIPPSFRHYQLGIAVFIMAIIQPLSSIPRFMTHHGHQVTSMGWAYLHWTIGRAAIVFAWVNMFLGIGRYRTWFTLGSWAEAALGCYIGGLLLVSLALEARLWRKHDLRARDEWDEVSQRISRIERPDRSKAGVEDDSILDQGAMHNTTSGLSNRSKASDHAYL